MGHEVGDTVVQTAFGVTHSYRLVGRRQYVARDGRTSEILTWECTCPACGAVFRAESGSRIRDRMVRGCPVHRPWTGHVEAGTAGAALKRRRGWYAHRALYWMGRNKPADQ